MSAAPSDYWGAAASLVTASRMVGMALGLAALFAGSLVGGWVAGFIGLRLTIVAAGCIGLLGALYLVLSPLRTVKELDEN